MQSELEDHLGNYSFTNCRNTKDKTMESISLFSRQQNATY